MAIVTNSQTVEHEPTVADLAARFGSLPARRIRTDVPPGTATEDDVDRLRLIEREANARVDQGV